MSKKRIMIIDDDKDILDIIFIILERNGYDAVKFNTAQNFIENVVLFKPEIIILDIQLGGVDGRTLCKAIKEMEAHGHILIILSSANLYYEKNAKEYLCDDFIAKPFDMVSLIDKINRLIIKQEDIIPAKIIP